MESDSERIGGTNHNHDCSGTTITHREGEGAAAATVTASKPPLHRWHVVRSPEPNSGVAFAGASVHDVPNEVCMNLSH